MVEIVEHGFCRFNLISIAGNRHLIAAGNQGSLDMLLDLRQMLMMTAKQKDAAAIVVEGQSAGANLEGGGNGFQARLSRLEDKVATGQPSDCSWSAGR